MKNLILAVLLSLIPTTINSSEQINIKGVSVVHYNASWNKKNNYTQVAKLKDVKILTAWIDKDNTVKESEGIRSLPTVIL